jgi:hypothetical protein
MKINEVGGLLGYSQERAEKLISEGLALPKSGNIVILSASRDGGMIDVSDEQFNEFASAFEAEQPGRHPPAGVRRGLLVESSHRCAICREGPPFQFHHMLDWAKLKHQDPHHMLTVCGTCHTRCTNGFIDYKSQVEYKTQIEQRTKSIRWRTDCQFRSIEDAELRPWLSVGERVGIRALEDEFGCEVRTNVTVPAGNGWVNFNAAVVRKEELVGIELHEYKGGGFPYFQVEHLAEVVSQTRFDRFQKCVLYVAVVSAVDESLDAEVQAELEKRKAAAPCELQIRMYRINPLRTKYSL